MYPDSGGGKRLRYSAFISYNHKDRIWAIVDSDAKQKIKLRL